MLEDSRLVFEQRTYLLQGNSASNCASVQSKEDDAIEIRQICFDYLKLRNTYKVKIMPRMRAKVSNGIVINKAGRGPKFISPPG